MDERMDIEATLQRALAALPPEEFEGEPRDGGRRAPSAACRLRFPGRCAGVLHPVFKEDEIKLILVGGLLGAAVGFLQIVTIFR